MLLLFLIVPLLAMWRGLLHKMHWQESSTPWSLEPAACTRVPTLLQGCHSFHLRWYPIDNCGCYWHCGSLIMWPQSCCYFLLYILWWIRNFHVTSDLFSSYFFHIGWNLLGWPTGIFDAGNIRGGYGFCLLRVLLITNVS